MDHDDDDSFDDELNDAENLDSDFDDDDGDSDDSDSEDDAAKIECTEEEYQAAQTAKLKRLFVEEHGRIPYKASELSHFIMSGDFERPVEPEECDFEAIRKKK